MSNSNYNKLLQHKLLSKEETYGLITTYQTSSDLLIKQKALEKLIKFNFKLIYTLAVKFISNHPTCDLDDAIQVVCLSVGKTVEKFDCSLNLEFSTYLFTWSRSYLQRYQQATGSTIRRPVHILESSRIIKRFIRDFGFIHNRRPTLQEISHGLNLSVEKIETCLMATRPISSLNSLTSSSDNPCELLELICDTNYSPNEYLLSLSQAEQINNLLNTLEPDDRQILTLKFNLNNDINPPTLNQISKQCGITREQVRARCIRAINNLRKSKEIKTLREFI